MIQTLPRLFRSTLLLFAFSLISFQLRADYCIPDYIIGTADGDYIDGVELGDISNFTGAGDDWNDYTGLSTVLSPGLTYDLHLYNTPVYAETYAAWIDWNQDEIFTDDERLNAIDLEIIEGGSDIITFTVPFTALPGTTRMRIMNVYFPDDVIDPCLTGVYNWGEAEDYSINIPVAGPYDLGVTGIIGLSTGCGLGETPLTVTITNLGTEPSGDFDVAYQVTDPVFGLLPVVTQDYTGPVIPSLGSAEFTFSIPVDLSNIGTYTIVAYTIYAPDIEPLDDESSQTLTAIPTIVSFPYYQDFEDGSAGWSSGGAESSWELGEPLGFAIVGPPPATPTSLNTWTTNLTGYYNLNEKSFVESPCLDFSSLILPYIQFDLNYDAQLYDDGAKLQYSTDGGVSWSDLGGLGTGENWYNHLECYAMYPTFYIDNYSGWSGNSSGWLHAEHDLAFLAGEPLVKLRFVFASSNYWNFNDGFAFDNIWIGDPFPNDIGITNIVAPASGPSLTAAESVTVEITNFGTLSQTGFNVTYKLDAGSPNTEIFPGTIAPGATATHTFATTENLSVDGDYTFTAWTSLVSDEDLFNDTISEIVSNLEPLTGTSAYYIYSNVTGFEPWYVVSNDTHMNDVFGVGEWTTEFYETVDPAILFSTGTCFIYLEGSDSHTDEMEAFITANKIAMENWVASGGHLILNAAPNEGDGMDLGFDDTHLDYPWYTDVAEAYDPTHPIWSGPFTPVTTLMNGGSYGHATVSGSDWTPILFDSFNPDKIVLAEKYWGAGTVVFGGMTPTDFHSPALETANFRKNLIAYLAVCTISDNDGGVQSILSPQTACGLTAEESVTIKVRNFGFLPQTNIPVSYKLGAYPTVTEIVPGTLGVGESIDYTFIETVDLNALGEYELVTWTDIALDTIYTNDTTISHITNIPVINSYPYVEDWESGSAEGWTTYGALSSWELGYPAGPVINTPPTETPSSQYSWATSITDNYNNGETSYLESPCFDMTDLTIPYVEFDLWWVTEEFWDGMQLEYSTNGGVTWTVLGDIGTGDFWYTDYAIALGFENAWVGNGPGWVTAHHDVTFLAGETDVKFRFFFAADDLYNFDGIGLDNFHLQDPFPNDIGVTELITPVSGTDLTSTEVVTVNIHNFGLLPQTLFPVSYQVDALTVITEMFTGTLDVGESEPFTFAATADLSLPGIYTICAWTSLPTDEDVSNDEIPGCQPVVNMLPVDGTMAYYIYSEAVGEEPGYLNSNSTAMDAVFGADAWTLDYYESLDVYTVFSNSTCFIFLEASEDHWSEFEYFLNNNSDLIEGWVSSGGNLFINASPWEGDGGDIGFGGVTVDYPWYTYNSQATDPFHPILNGPFTPVTADLFGFYVGEAKTTGAGITPIINDYDCPDCYILSEKGWGDGRVLFGNMGAPEYYSPTTEAQNLRQNILDYLKLCTPVDIGVTELVTPLGGCGMTNAEEVTIVITNFGPTTVTNTPVKYQIDGGPVVVSETALGPVPVGGTYTYSFDALADLSAAGTHTVETWTDFSGDADETNDLLITETESLETPVIELGPNMTICDEVVLDAGNPGSTYLWSTGATTQTITVTVSDIYSVTITDPTSGCAVTDEVNVTVNYTPVADFSFVITGLTVTFTNLSTGGAAYNWSFGDGGTSTTANPSHNYAVEGSYTVTLTVTNGCGSAFYSFVIEVGNAISEPSISDLVSVYPNPTSGNTTISINLTESTELTLELVNTLGQIMWTSTPGIILNKTFDLDLSQFASGVYQLNIKSPYAISAKQIILNK